MTERLNIRRFEMPAPQERSRLQFDSERDLSSSDWARAREELEKFRKLATAASEQKELASINWRQFLELAAAMHVLEGNQRIRQEDLNAADLASSVIISSDEDLFPQLESIIYLAELGRSQIFTDEGKTRLLEEFEKERNGENEYKGLNEAFFVLTTLGVPHPEPTDTDWQNMRSAIPNETTVAATGRTDRELDLYRMKLIGGKNLPITQEDWDSLNSKFEKYRKGGDMVVAFRYAQRMAVLAAYEAEIKDGHIMLTMHNPSEEREPTPLPETKRI